MFILSFPPLWVKRFKQRLSRIFLVIERTLSSQASSIRRIDKIRTGLNSLSYKLEEKRGSVASGRLSFKQEAKEASRAYVVVVIC